MTRYLLDTNVISQLVRNPGGPVDIAMRRNIDAEIGTSLIVKGEILYGLKRNANVRGKERLDYFLQAVAVWSMDATVAEIYGDVRAEMEKQGTLMGPNDMWIAAHSLALDAVLVTDDRIFSAVPELKIENWQRP